MTEFIMRRRVAVVGTLLLLLAAAAWIWSARDGGADSRKRTAARGDQTVATQDGGMAGMDMNEDGAVLISAAQLREFGITFGTVAERVMAADIRATGTVTAAETGVVMVTSKTSGYVERLHANFVGIAVRRGQPLMELYSKELVAAQEELLLAARVSRAVGDGAVPGVPNASTDLLSSARRRLRLLDVPNAQIDEVLRTGRIRRTVTVVSPASGYVTEKRVVEGQSINAGEPLLTLADLSRVWVEVEVRENDAAALRPGLTADIEFAALAGRPFKGRVEFVQPIIDPSTRTIRARVGVANTGMALKPGMYATVTVLIPSRTALTVPTSAVINTGERFVVFVDMGNGRLMPHDVVTGAATGDLIEVLSGLTAGQRVVTSAQFILESESNIGEVMRAMMGQMTAPPGGGN